MTSISIWGISLIFIITGCYYSVISNKAYFKLYFAYEQGYAFSNRLIGRLENVENFSEDSIIYYIGTPSTKTYAVPETHEIDNLMGIISDIPSTYKYTTAFLKNYLGFTPQFISLDDSHITEIDSIRNLDIENMSIYPSAGSIIEVDKNILVKFSDN